MTSYEFSLYVKQNILGINFEYIMIKNYEERKHPLTPCFQGAKNLKVLRNFIATLLGQMLKHQLSVFQMTIEWERKIYIVWESEFLKGSCKAPKVNSEYITAGHDGSW